MRGLRWRAASMVAVAIVGLFWWVAGGGFKHVIQIQWGIEAELFEGAEVVIDGEVVGTLSRIGARTVTGFEVEPGRYRVEVRKPGYASEAREVDTEREGGTALLMLDVSERMGASGRLEPVILMY